MPELPEVETIIRGLRQLIKGKNIIEVIIQEEKLIEYPEPDQFKQELANKLIIDITRRGKYILFKLQSEKILVFHLRMTGKLLVKARKEDYDKYTYIIFKLEGEQDLRFISVRKFSRVYLVDQNCLEEAGSLDNLGPEPLAKNFQPEDFQEKFQNRTAKIKSLLLKQDFIAGLGNIYADEALFRAGISPLRKANTLTDEEIEKLYYAIREILCLAIKYCGTTFSDYADASGEAGNFQNKLQVYQHEGEECPLCKSKIVREKISGRSSFYCPRCQQ